MDLLAVLDTIKKVSDNIYWGNMGRQGTKILLIWPRDASR